MSIGSFACRLSDGDLEWYREQDERDQEIYEKNPDTCDNCKVTIFNFNHVIQNNLHYCNDCMLSQIY